MASSLAGMTQRADGTLMQCRRLSTQAVQSEVFMRVLGYTWAGVRTADLKSTTRFFSDVLGLNSVEESRGLAQFELPSGHLFEVFGSENRYYQFHAYPVVGFQVESVREAK